MGSIRIEEFVEEAVPDINSLIEVADAEGHSFVCRTLSEWADATNRFDKPAETFLLAYDRDDLVGMGGVNLDPYVSDPQVARLRHVYVHPEHRGRGIGEQIVARCLQHAGPLFNLMRLRTPGPDADRFYERLGFQKVDSDSATHRLRI